MKRKSGNYYRDKANLENLRQYLSDSENLTASFLANPQNLESILQKEFERVSGIDLDEILNKHPNDRTLEEKQILTDYGAFKTTKIEEMYKELDTSIDNTKEKNVVDAAILALDVYGDDKEGWLSKTNYKRLDLESLSNNGVSNEHLSILKVAEEINKCNKTQSETGFDAELYYNEVTDTYVIAFRGTKKELNDIKTDAKIGSNAVLGTNFEIKTLSISHYTKR